MYGNYLRFVAALAQIQISLRTVLGEAFADLQPLKTHHNGERVITQKIGNPKNGEHPIDFLGLVEVRHPSHPTKAEGAHPRLAFLWSDTSDSGEWMQDVWMKHNETT